MRTKETTKETTMYVRIVDGDRVRMTTTLPKGRKIRAERVLHPVNRTATAGRMYVRLLDEDNVRMSYRGRSADRVLHAGNRTATAALAA